MVICAAVALASDAPVSRVAYFSRTRNVTAGAADKQDYVVLDEAIFNHARADLGDLRIFAGEAEVPYSIVVKRGSTQAALSSVPVLNKGTVNGNTQFAVDVGIPEYDELHIDLATRDFIAQAKVEGANDLAEKNWNQLGAFTIFDFTREKLGSNFNVRLHSPSRFRFLRITIVGPVEEKQVQGAGIANLQESKAKYIDLSEQPSAAQAGKKTVYEWDASDRVPLDRLHFEVDPAEVNFNRSLTLICDKRVISNGELSRLRMQRSGRKIETEDLDMDLAGLRCKHYKVEIANGDDRPLHITAMRPQMLERRAYFNARGQISFTLYYGDEKLEPPLYDYAKLFEEPEAAQVAQAVMSSDMQNTAFTPRPDERPWSERHPAVLWIAMIAAVGLLGAWALKGFKG